MVRVQSNLHCGDLIIQRPKPKSGSESKNRAKKFPQNFSHVGFSVTKNTIILAYIV
jgi:hypothetical protein